MKTKEEILKEFLSPDRQSEVGYLPITADALKLELLADIRDEQVSLNKTLSAVLAGLLLPAQQGGKK